RGCGRSRSSWRSPASTATARMPPTSTSCAASPSSKLGSVATGEDEARRRNEQLVAQLESSGTLRDPAIAGAFPAGPRHRFLPGRPLDEVYEDSAIMTKVGARGLPLSSSSQPTIMAIMLQLLRPRPGNRVLEIGAGTGYNAALIAHLVAPRGRVV